MLSQPSRHAADLDVRSAISMQKQRVGYRWRQEVLATGLQLCQTDILDNTDKKWSQQPSDEQDQKSIWMFPSNKQSWGGVHYMVHFLKHKCWKKQNYVYFRKGLLRRVQVICSLNHTSLTFDICSVGVSVK